MNEINHTVIEFSDPPIRAEIVEFVNELKSRNICHDLEDDYSSFWAVGRKRLRFYINHNKQLWVSNGDTYGQVDEVNIYDYPHGIGITVALKQVGLYVANSELKSLGLMDYTKEDIQKAIDDVTHNSCYKENRHLIVTSLRKLLATMPVVEVTMVKERV